MGGGLLVVECNRMETELNSSFEDIWMDEAEGLDRMGSIGWARWADGPSGGGGRASSGTRHLHAMRI